MMAQKSAQALMRDGYRKETMDRLFLNEQTRDTKIAEYRKAAEESEDIQYAYRGVKKTNIQLHPEYIEDALAEGITYETGFGNTDYKRFWKVLWAIEVWYKVGRMTTFTSFDSVVNVLGKDVRLGKIDMYSYNGRSYHPKPEHEGKIGKVVGVAQLDSQSLDDYRIPEEFFAAGKFDPEEEFIFFWVLVGGELLEIVDEEIEEIL